ncbi:pentraxin fusion protein-like [Xenopus tropicalis]|uniref:Pentraxin fusion protein-like n=1 Tax=Xenopus tropicalis TaxID=8364 RepID=A0A8J1JPU7_XENTR|nr:pentraxin fusion protein-like [Xenopus tropicalis]
MEGRYVSVVIPGRREYLTLCEVEVYGEKLADPTGVNLARLGEAWQSSNYESYPAEAAIDGIKVTDLFTHPCTHTYIDNPAWWRLDLKKRYKVQTVIIVNRGDCCWERLLGAEIHIGNSADDNNPV